MHGANVSAFAREITSADFNQVVIQGSLQVPVLVDFWAPWCGPCRALTPVLEKLADYYKGKFQLVRVNSDENLDLAREYGIRSIPNVKAFVNGQVVDKFLGARRASVPCGTGVHRPPPANSRRADAARCCRPSARRRPTASAGAARLRSRSRAEQRRNSGGPDRNPAQPRARR